MSRPRRPAVDADTAARVRELAEATGRSEREVLAGAVRLLGIHHALLWTSGVVRPARVAPAEDEA